MINRACLLVAATMLSWHSIAHELTTKISLDFEYSDNSLLVPNREKVNDTQTIPTLNVNYRFTFPNFEATLQYNASRTEYHDDTFEDRNDVLGEGTFLWTILSERLFWNFYQNRNRLTIDSDGLDNPANETERNVIQTGPEFRLNFGRASSLSITYDYSDSSFDEGDLNTSNQNSYKIRYQQGIGASTQIGFTAQYSDVEFDTNIINYTNERFGLSLSGQGRKYQYTVDFGSNKIKRKFGDSASGPFIKINATYTGIQSTWEINLNKELTDSTTGLTLSNNPGRGLDSGDTNFDNEDVVDRSRIELSYRNDLAPGRWSFNTKAFFDRQDFEILREDEDSTGFNINLTYRFGNNLSLVYRFEWEDNDFEQTAANDQGSISRRNRIDFTYTPNSKQNYVIWIADNQRNFSTQNRDYKEFTTGITLQYQL